MRVAGKRGPVCVSLGAGSAVSTASARSPGLSLRSTAGPAQAQGRSLPCQPRPGRVYNLPARAPRAAASLALLLQSGRESPARRLKDFRLARARARIHIALHRTLSHSSPLTLITLSHTRANTYGSAPPGTRAHTSPLTPHSRPGALALQGRAGTAGESPRGLTASPWLT